MKVHCCYNTGYDVFLKEVVNIVLGKYGAQLNLTTLEEIELIRKEEIPYETDGQVLNANKIIVTSRLYDLLPTLEIDSLNDNEDYGMLKKTLYHEMGHINDMSLMPNLYNCILESFENRNVDADSLTSLFWVEYIAEKRTAFFENVYNLGICDDFVRRKWHCSMTDPYAHYGERNFFYLTKLLPYFMARTGKEDIRERYINQIENKLLVQYINEIDVELGFLETKEIFDDIKNLKGLYTIIDKYCNKFMRKYK